ncbi:MAG: cytochrome c biogenesis CcdA family protein [Candidatus Bathyarchaeia archaeon]
MSVLLLAYLIVAFVAGLVALAMPCCFSVLLPSYFAQSFKQKTRRLGMTLIFGLGIAVVLLPIALGFLTLARTITTNHSLLFVAGGFLMIILGFWTLWGQGMLPRLDLPVNLNKTDTPSVFVLGVFSGTATTCCVPVLAGVILLGTLSASLLEGVLIGLTYVAGMVFPLLLVALVWDKYAIKGESPLRGRMLHFNYLGSEYAIHSSKLIPGIMFTVMGVVTVLLGLSGRMIQTPGSALIGLMQAQLTNAIVNLLSNSTFELMTSVIFGAVVILSVVLIVKHIRKS